MDDIIKNSVKPVQNVFSSYVDPTLENPVVGLIVSFIAIVSVIYTLDDMPEELKRVFKHPGFTIFASFAVVYNGTKKVDTAILSALAFAAIFYGIKFVSENFQLIFPETDTIPGCSDVTVKDLLDLFEGDREQLKKAMYVSGVPLDVEINDVNAPLIATYLINSGKDVNDKCRAPN